MNTLPLAPHLQPRWDLQHTSTRPRVYTMTTAATPAVLSAYRTLLRSIKLTFVNDTRMLTAAMTESRHSFRSRSHVSDAEQEEHLKHAREIAEVLRTNVVQGERVEGAYSERT